MNDINDGLNFVWFFITGVWNVITSNLLLSIPIGMFIMWNVLKILKNLFKILKKGE